MARPKIPLISKRETLQVSLRIIDEEGLDELSIRRLARELNVVPGSLYHHFPKKEDILIGAAQLVLDDARLLDSDGDWQEWFINQARLYRRALLEHPALVSVILMQHPHRIAPAFYDAAVQLLIENDVPEPQVIPLIESMESFTFGSVLYTVAARKDLAELADLEALSSAESHAVAHVEDERLWEATARAIMGAVLGFSAEKPSKAARVRRPAAAAETGRRSAPAPASRKTPRSR